MMNQGQRIRMAAAYKGVTLSSLAKSKETSVQNFLQRLDRGTVTEEEIDGIADDLGAKYIRYLEFPDGTKI